MSWCPQCGAEYRAGFADCADCGVALVDEPPEAAPRRAASDRSSRTGGDHSIVEYDIDDWSAEQRLVLELELDGAQIPYAWYDGKLQVGHAREAEVDQLIDSIEGEEIEGELIEGDDVTDVGAAVDFEPDDDVDIDAEVD